MISCNRITECDLMRYNPADIGVNRQTLIIADIASSMNRFL